MTSPGRILSGPTSSWRIDDVVEKKLAVTAAMPSQFYEGGANGGPQLVPSDEAGKTKRKNEVREDFTKQFAATATQYRAKLRELYGPEKGDAVQYCGGVRDLRIRAAAHRRRDQAPVSVLSGALGGR